MTKKVLIQDNKYNEELIDTIEQNFIFNDKPINKIKNVKINNFHARLNKEELEKLKYKINSITNCKLKDNSKNLVFGDGNKNSPVMLIGEAPGLLEDNSGLTFQGNIGALLNNMLNAININRDNVYCTYSINFRTPEDRKPISQEIKRYSPFLKGTFQSLIPKL